MPFPRAASSRCRTLFNIEIFFTGAQAWGGGVISAPLISRLPPGPNHHKPKHTTVVSPPPTPCAALGSPPSQSGRACLIMLLTACLPAQSREGTGCSLPSHQPGAARPGRLRNRTRGRGGGPLESPSASPAPAPAPATHLTSSPAPGFPQTPRRRRGRLTLTGWLAGAAPSLRSARRAN